MGKRRNNFFSSSILKKYCVAILESLVGQKFPISAEEIKKLRHINGEKKVEKK